MTGPSKTAHHISETLSRVSKATPWRKRSAQVGHDRRQQGSKPNGRDSPEARGAAREPGGDTPVRRKIPIRYCASRRLTCTLLRAFYSSPRQPDFCARHGPRSATKTGRDLEHVVKLGGGIFIDGTIKMGRSERRTK